MNNAIRKSEFGAGFCYCLGLFLAHTEKIGEYQKAEKKQVIPNGSLYPSLWMNGAADHIKEFHAESSPIDFRKRAIAFKSKVLAHRLLFDEITWEEVQWSLSEAKQLLLLVDEFLGIKTVVGNYE